jgi:hypothetical protein
MQSTVAQKPENSKSNHSDSAHVNNVKHGTTNELGAEAGMPIFLQRAVASNSSSFPYIQRLCDECANERMEDSLLVQNKLTIGAPDDKYEQEADQVAVRVMRMPLGWGVVEIQQKTVSPIQAKSKGGNRPYVTPFVQSVVRSPGVGSPLNKSIRSRIESILGADLSKVSVHMDGAAQRAAQDIGAKAFTHGSDIFLGGGQSARDVELMAHEATHVIQQSQSGLPNIQCNGKFRNRPPTAIEATVSSFANRNAMGEYLASSSVRMLETQTNLQGANPENQDEAQLYEEQIKNLLRLNAIGLMASHMATIEGRRSSMFSVREGDSRVQLLRDVAANIHRLEQAKEQLEGYVSNLRGIQSSFFRQGENDLGDVLEDLALNSNQLMLTSERHAMVERYQSVLRSNSSEMMWHFVYGSANYMKRIREVQIDAVKASLSLFFQNFPVFSKLDADDVFDGDYEDDSRLEQQANRSFADVIIAIHDTIRDIHRGDKDPLDMPIAIRATRQELPASLQTVLDDMKNGHDQFRFWLNMGLTAAEIALAFIPVIGPVLALGVGVANLAIQGEEIMDRMEMAEVGANPYGNNPLGVTEPSAFEQTMFGVTAILSVVGAGSIVSSLRGGRASVTAMEEVAAAATGSSDDILEAGGTTATTSSRQIGGGTDDVVDITDSQSVRMAEGSDETITLYHGTDQRGFEGLGGIDDGRISVTRSSGEHQDFSQGFYLSEDVSVAESAAGLRGGQREGGMQHILRYDIQADDLGVIVDVRSGGVHRELWDAYLDTQFQPLVGMRSHREYLTGLGVEQRGIFFEEFLESIGKQNADTIMGPIGESVTVGAVTSINGQSTQVVIRSQRVADRLNEIMRGQ